MGPLLYTHARMLLSQLRAAHGQGIPPPLLDIYSEASTAAPFMSSSRSFISSITFLSSLCTSSMALSASVMSWVESEKIGRAHD